MREVRVGVKEPWPGGCQQAREAEKKMKRKKVGGEKKLANLARRALASAGRHLPSGLARPGSAALSCAQQVARSELVLFVAAAARVPVQQAWPAAERQVEGERGRVAAKQTSGEQLQFPAEPSSQSASKLPRRHCNVQSQRRELHPFSLAS